MLSKVASSPQGLEEPNSLKRKRFIRKQKYTFLTNVNPANKIYMWKILVTAQHSKINTFEEIGGGAGSGLIRHSRLPSMKSRDKNKEVY